MAEYEPLDLGPYLNAGVSFVGNDALQIGELQYHGLPFMVGGAAPDPARCLIGLGGDRGYAPVAIAIGRTAHTLIIAHRLLESQLDAGEPVGRHIADYCIEYADGGVERVAIRERFEIGMAPPRWGHLAFLAWPDEIDTTAPRYEGRWDDFGSRMTEVDTGWPRNYYLWLWVNPRPEQPIARLRIEPADRAFVVAAITAGALDEIPFARTARRRVRISLPQEADATRPFDLTVAVDRGMATYPHPLPSQPAEAFLADAMRGWGEAQNTTSSPAYVEIAAAPSATVTIASHGEELARVRWSDLERDGAVATSRARVELVDPGRNWVHVTVVDDATGAPIPCRVHFRAPDGTPYQPHGHHAQVNSNLDTWHVDVGGDLRLGQITYAYIDGRCQGWLPRGTAIVDVARGFEYEPLRAQVEIAPGQQELTLRLKRWTDMNAAGWYSGDSHVHFLGAQGAQFEARGEDLNVVNLLASQWGHLFTNTEDFIGEPTVTRDGKTIIYASQENRQHLLGHLTLWGLKRPVMPWGSDGPSEAELGGSLETTLSHWADATRAQGGTVIIPHLPTPNCEPAVLIATGRADAVEMLTHRSFEHVEYYRYLNGGYRLPLVGGTDKMSSEVPVGLYRTYAYIPPEEEFNYENWCRAVRLGRTFLSGGPLLRFSIDGAQIGDTLRLPRGGGTVEVEAVAESIFPLHTLQIVQQGRVVAATEEQAGARRLTLRAKLQVDGNTWLAARCGGPEYTARPHHDVWRRGVFAHTSPIYVAVGGEWELFDSATAQYMLTLAEGGLAHMRHKALHDRPGSVTHHHGESDHQAFLERPFHEAIAAIHRRMHQLGIAH